MGFLKKALSSLPALFIALASGGLAWLWLKVGFLAALGATLGIGLLGAVMYAMARNQLYRSPPRTTSSVQWLEWAGLSPSAGAAGAGAVAIWLAINRTAKSSPENKALISALVTALST